MFGRVAALGVAIFSSMAASPARANVICAVVERGRTTCTFFCQNGYTCDLANRKCLPGPEVLKKVHKMLDEASRLKRNLNGDKIKERTAKEAQMFGQQRGQYYYKWDGNPKEMPTPRYRPQYNFAYTKGTPRVSTPVRRVSSNAPSRIVVRSYLETLLTSAQRLPVGDSSRANIITTARTLVASNKIPFDIDAFLCHSAELPASQGRSNTSVAWKVADVEQEVIDRGLCAEAGDKKIQCVAENFGLVVLEVEPEIRARCRAQEQDPELNIGAVAACADRMLRNAWSQTTPARASTRASAEQCPPPSASPSRPDSGADLRRRLKAALAALPDTVDVSEPETSVGTPAPEPAKTDAPPPPDADMDEAFCSYIARRSVRGELTPGDGTPLPEYCKKAFETAKSCTDQSCSMADVIAEEERRQKSNALAWGAADRESIAALQKPLLDRPAPPNAAPPAPTANTVSPVAPVPTVNPSTPTTPSPTASAPSVPSTPVASPTVNPPSPTSPNPIINAPTPTTPSPTVNTPSPIAPSAAQATTPQGPTINTQAPTVASPTVTPSSPTVPAPSVSSPSPTVSPPSVNTR